MTERKRFKHLVRERMSRTGERYAAARRQILRAEPGSSSPRQYPFLHFPGSIPAAASLRALLANAGVRAPHTGAPLTEVRWNGSPRTMNATLVTANQITVTIPGTDVETSDSGIVSVTVFNPGPGGGTIGA